MKDEKRKKKKKAKKQNQGMPNNTATSNPKSNCNDVQKELNIPKDPSEDAEYLVGYGTNAMIYNNNAGESDSSEDEGIEDYKIGGYPPVHIGYSEVDRRELCLERYVILQKLGWGHFSTVWLAKDLQHNSFVAVKIQKSAQQYIEAAFDEVEILEQVSTKWKTEEWRKSFQAYQTTTDEANSDSCYCIQLLNSFIHFGPNGKHFAMVFEILGVTLLEVIKRYNYKGVPLPLVRLITRQVLIGLDYLHRVCHIIHTDLKPENVLLCLTSEEVKEIVSQAQFGKSKGKYKYGADPLGSGVEAEDRKAKADQGRPAEELTEEERKELKRQRKREKKKRLKKKKQQAKAGVNKENGDDEDADLDGKEEVKTKPEEQPKVITNTIQEKPNIKLTKRRLSDPTTAPSLAGTQSNWEDELVKLQPDLTPEKKPSSSEAKPYTDR